jgi:PqqD family protein of HPr-rel-A system
MSTPLSEIMLNDRGFAFDPTTGESFQLSTTGLEIILALRHAPDRDAALTKLIEEFEVDENTARRDFDQFLASIEQIGWLP